MNLKDGSHERALKWTMVLNPEELRKLHPITRSKFIAYMDPPAGVRNLIQRINERLRKEKIQQNLAEQLSIMKEHEKEKVNIVIGRLKAAEARQRIHVVHMNLRNKVDKKLDQLVYVQPTGVHAVRTEYLVRSRPLEYLPGGKLNLVKADQRFHLTISEKSRLATLLDEKII